MQLQEQSKLKIWLDCDPGNDDALAIIMALFTPSVDLLGLSTVFGNHNIAKVTANAVRILSAAKRTDIPVFMGAKESLHHTKIDCEIHGSEGLFGAEKLKQEFDPIKEGSLYDLILSRTKGDKFIFVMTGAHTNAAILFKEHPDILKHISQVIFMGGSAGFGNATPNAEFNIFADPNACQQVLTLCHQADVPIVMASLDITHTVLVTDEIVNEIKAIGTPFTDWCCEMLYQFAHTYKMEEFEFPPLHDPVAMYYAINPKSFKTRFINVEVETETGLCFGRTVCDKFGTLKKQQNVHFCDKVNLGEFWSCMIAAIKAASLVVEIQN